MPITAYLAECQKLYAAGNATEHSYRPALQKLLAVLMPQCQITNEPKRIACGAPDYIITRNDLPVGYIEAKDINLDLRHKTTSSSPTTSISSSTAKANSSPTSAWPTHSWGKSSHIPSNLPNLPA